jgi:uncharacterized protein (TIGR00369 family)
LTAWGRILTFLRKNGVVDEALTDRIRRAMPYAALLGVEVEEASAEQVRGRLPWDESRCTSAGILHGGALMGLADALAGLCAFLNLPEGALGTATIESKTNFFRPVASGHVDAVARVLHRGRTTIVLETDLRDADGKHVARVTQTQAVLT